jgi:death-on-curing protein
VSVQYPDLADYLAVAAAVTGLDDQTLLTATKLELADSALRAPSAGAVEQDLYPDFVDKAAVLIVRLAKNHPLLDGNKRAARVTVRLLIEMNGWSWNPYPSNDEAEQSALSVASGEWNETRTAQWLRAHLMHLTLTSLN